MTLNVELSKEIERVYREELQAHHVEINKTAAPMALLDMPTFCAAWPRIHSFLNMAVNLLSFVNADLAVKAKAGLATISRVMIPMVCPTPDA